MGQRQRLSSCVEFVYTNKPQQMSHVMRVGGFVQELYTLRALFIIHFQGRDVGTYYVDCRVCSVYNSFNSSGQRLARGATPIIFVIKLQLGGDVPVVLYLLQEGINYLLVIDKTWHSRTIFLDKQKSRLL